MLSPALAPSTSPHCFVMICNLSITRLALTEVDINDSHLTLTCWAIPIPRCTRHNVSTITWFSTTIVHPYVGVTVLNSSRTAPHFPGSILRLHRLHQLYLHHHHHTISPISNPAAVSSLNLHHGPPSAQPDLTQHLEIPHTSPKKVTTHNSPPRHRRELYPSEQLLTLEHHVHTLQ